MNRFFIAFVGCSLASIAAYGQQDTTNNLNEVMVKENRLKIPFSAQNRNIWIIDQQQIKNLPSRSITDLLGFVSGVDIRQRGPGGVQADISLDGGTFDQTLILVNGVKFSDPQTGHHMMNLPFSVDDIDHIEVLRGSASRIYGLNALTGAINIVTKTATRSGGSAHVFAGSSFRKDDKNGDLYTNYGIRASGSVVLDGSTHLVSAGQEAGNGYRHNTAFNNQKVYYQGTFKIKSDVLDVSAGYIHNNFGANGYYSAPGDLEAEETVKTTTASVGYQTQITSFWTLKPRLTYRNNVDDYLYIKQTPDKFHNHHVTQVLGAELNNVFSTGIGDFGLGLEARKELINSTNLGKRNRTNAGIYGEYKFDRVKNVLINIGNYLNYNSDYGWQAFPGIDAGYNFAGNWKVFVNAGTGQRLPTFTDLYYKGPTNIGNAELKAERSAYLESGLKYNGKRLNLNASIFERRINNFIDWVKAEVTDPWQPKNFSRLSTRGYTLSADYAVPVQGQVFTSIRTGISLTHLDPRMKTTLTDALISRYSVESLRNQYTLTVSGSLWDKLDISLTSRYAERINYKDYVILDARVGYRFNKSTLYWDGSNLLNEQFNQAGAVPMPGVWTTLGYKIQF
ncbi:TonB-dependent receptor plug domain-containing protein [Pedobacter antarcticus]|uniref:TonB-dependent receptor plug domain-containing protein n=1 Tax=Pedobacter antarcticus TaxID=34086 RepID=UPI00087EBC69|nr:TonB-dependent receptor [Pedobacter antarcticus]SDL51010.1 iron complex outermembrane recepter protein [Pedobacter antarcticus]